MPNNELCASCRSWGDDADCQIESALRSLQRRSGSVQEAEGILYPIDQQNLLCERLDYLRKLPLFSSLSQNNQSVVQQIKPGTETFGRKRVLKPIRIESNRAEVLYTIHHNNHTPETNELPIEQEFPVAEFEIRKVMQRISLENVMNGVPIREYILRCLKKRWEICKAREGLKAYQQQAFESEVAKLRREFVKIYLVSEDVFSVPEQAVNLILNAWENAGESL